MPAFHRWLIYSANPAGDTFGGLDSGNTAIWNTAAGANEGATGNRYVFAYQPILTVTATDASKTYGDSVTLSGYTITGVQPGVSGAYLADTSAMAYGGDAAITSTGAAVTADVGSYNIMASQGTLTSSAGYGFTFVNGTLAVTQRALTVTADAQSRTYGNANPALTYAVGGLGLVNGDTLSGGLATTATSISNVGSYGIAQGTLAASSNNALVYVSSNLAVSQRALNVTVDAQTRIFGSANPAFTYTVGGLVNGDILLGSLATRATTASPAGTYAITQGTVVASGNYVLSYQSALLTITASTSSGKTPTPPSTSFGSTFGSPGPDPTPTEGTSSDGSATGGIDGYSSQGYDKPITCVSGRTCDNS